MLEYLAQNFGYILVAGVLLLIVTAIILRMVRNRRAGKADAATAARAAPTPPSATRKPTGSRTSPPPVPAPHRRRMTLCPIASPAI